jgi:hypothetical protein
MNLLTIEDCDCKNGAENNNSEKLFGLHCEHTLTKKRFLETMMIP